MISGVFGLPGAGKTVLLSKMADKALRGKPMKIGSHFIHYGEYEHVLTNFYCEGCEKFEFTDLGRVDYSNSLILLDEASIFADSREFKNFTEDARFFMQQFVRKSGSCFVWCSQAWDAVDKRIRDLTDNYYYIRPAKIFSDAFSTIIPIDPAFDIVQGKPSTFYEFAPIAKRGYIYLPKYWDRIDTTAYAKKRELLKPEFVKW